MSLKEKTAELCRLNEELKYEIDERKRAEEQLEQRNKLLSTLLEVSNMVSSTLEIKPLLEAILDSLKVIIDYKGAKIFIVDEEVLRVVAYRSQMPESGVKEYCFLYKKSLIGLDIIMSRKAVVIPDVTADDPMAKAFRETFGACSDEGADSLRSWLGIPMIIKDRVIGVLAMDHSEKGFYLQEHVSFGTAFANQAAIEYENARLYSETIKRTDELETMLNVKQAITSRLELKAVIDMIADDARRLTHSERTAVFLVDGDDLVLSVFLGKDSRSFIGYRLPIDKSLIGSSMIIGKPVIINDVKKDPQVFGDLVLKADIKSFLSVPLKAGSKQIGTITVVDKIKGEFNTDDERVLSMLGSIAVIGLENARMYEEEKLRHIEDEKQRRVAEGLRDILAILNSNRPLADILEFIIKQAASLMNTASGSLYRFKKDENILRLDAVCGLPEGFLKHILVPDGAGAIGRSVTERKPVFVKDISMLGDKSIDVQGLNNRQEWITQYCKGLLAVPLICKDEVYGGIALYFKDIRSFSVEDIELAMTLADQAALAIDNARLRAQAERNAVAAERSRIARDLHDAVTQTLFSSSLIAEVLPKIWDRNRDEGLKRLDELRQLTRGALAEMRTLLLELRPATLVEAKLDDLLRQLCEGIIGRARVPVALHIEGQAELPTDAKIALYRIAQEALNNVSKHSGASKATVALNYNCTNTDGKRAVELVVSDNGKGFNPDFITGDHLGIGIMRERTEAIGAKLKVESQMGKGTDIIVNWEIPGEENGNG